MAEASVIRLLILDVDGVLTDGRLWYGPQDEPLRAFHVHDGLAIQWFQRLGGTAMILTAKWSRAVTLRAADLGVTRVVQGSRDKLADLQRAARELAIDLRDAAMIGDDLPDLAAMRACGYSIAVANAAGEVRAAATHVTERRGGDGAVREAIEHLLRKDGRWEQVLAHFGARGK